MLSFNRNIPFHQKVVFLFTLMMFIRVSGNAMPEDSAAVGTGGKNSGSAVSSVQRQMPEKGSLDSFFILLDGRDLMKMVNASTRTLLTGIRGENQYFNETDRKHYCKLKQQRDIQWQLVNLETFTVVCQSRDPQRIFFGASASKLFVAAALLNKQGGELNPKQLDLMIRMIAVSSNPAWKELQRQAGDGNSDDSGRKAVDEFARHMGYGRIKAFQGWFHNEIHGNEVNATAFSKLLYDTYHNRYPGAEILWKLMYTCRTGAKKGNLFMPGELYIGGKTGTYHGPNASPETMKFQEIRAHNHVMTFNWKGSQYGLTILSNRGNDEDVAVLAGGLVREFLGMPVAFDCRPVEKMEKGA